MKPNDILFKAKMKDGSGWVFWNIYGTLTGPSGKAKRYSKKTQYGISYRYAVTQMAIDIDSETISVSTSFKDRNKNRVFEGDVVRINVIGSRKEAYGKIVRDKDGLVCVVDIASGSKIPLSSYIQGEIQIAVDYIQ